MRTWAGVIVATALAFGAGTAHADASDIAYRHSWSGKRYFHPLASFANLNRAVASGQRRRAGRLASTLVARGNRRGTALVWRYHDRRDGPRTWESGLAQAVAAQALARAGRMRDARRAFLAIPNGLLMHLPQGPWIKLYSYSNVVVLNAQLQAALSIGEYARRAKDARAKRLARRMRWATLALLPRFDTGWWSRYSLGGRAATLGYHTYVTELLWKLAKRRADRRWRMYASRFSRYRNVPPVLRRGRRARPVMPVPADGFRDFTSIGFWLSKPATVSFKIAGTRTSQWFQRGWQTFRWWPESVSPGRYPVRARATDAAGNSTRKWLPWVTVERDRDPPSVRVALSGTRLEWYASDSGSPWFDVRLERVARGRVQRLELGRFERAGRARLAAEPVRPWDVALLIEDSSGNVARVPLCLAR